MFQVRLRLEPTATPPSTKYQCIKPLSQNAIPKKNGSLVSGIQA
jgi:hypothetical protein